ncbi:TetR/AcrR family transcriptional regulator [bacterium]|nr:MAG: TetR/AcrR family transcriptional regulator [bacterium]MCL4231424.1 TetR/AcrR family transcriptional regulator [Dehalococcoidia bacterium]
MPKVDDAHLAARRQSILEAACKVFCTRGIRSATMAEVAAEAGISPGAIYRYFPSKDDLARVCMADSEAVMSRWKMPPEPGEDPLRELIELARLTFSLLDGPHERTEVILMLERVLAAVREGDAEVLQALRAEELHATRGVAQRLAAARDKNELPATLDPQLFAEAMISFYWGSRLARLINPGADVQGHLEQLMGMLVRSSASPAPA